MNYNEFSNEYLSCKWNIEIFFCLLEFGKRPSEILQTTTGISKKVFYERISFLLDRGLLEKRVITIFPSNVEYKFSVYGEKMIPFFYELKSLRIETEALSLVFKCKWVKAILFSLSGRSLRSMELKNAIGDISNKVLSEKLRKLEDCKLIDRTLKAEVPVRVDYKACDSGQRLTVFLTKYFQM